MLGVVLAAANLTVIAPALPRIVGELGAIELYSWLAIAAMMSSTLVVPIVGKLSDLYGRKPFYVGGVVVFMAGSLFAGLAPDFATLVAGRLLQGLGIGAVMPLAQTIVADIVSPRERGHYQGLIAGAWGVAAIAGPLVGGAVTDAAGWRWLFLLNLPLGATVLAFVLPFMRLRHAPRHVVIDHLGMVTLTVSVACVLLASVSGGVFFAWVSWEILALAMAGAGALVLFVFAERRAREPVIPLHLWRDRSFALANISVFATAMVMFGSIFYVPVLVQGVTGTATDTGVALVPLFMAIAGGSILNGQIIFRTGRYKAQLLVGLTLTLLGTLLLAQMRPGAVDRLLPAMLLVGAGLGMAMQTFTIIVQNAVSQRDMGAATATTQLARSLGASLGTALLGVVLVQALESAGRRNDATLALGDALQTVFLAMGPVSIVAITAAALIPETPLRRATPGAESPPLT